MMDLTQQELDRAGRSGQPPAFFRIDADDFKTINDEYGHDAGDAALRAISAHLKNTLRSHDIVGRFGGDEFAVLLPATTEPDARIIAERLSAIVRNTPLPFNNREIRLIISVGTAAAEIGSRDFDALVHLRQSPQILIRNWNKRLAFLALALLIRIMKRR